MSLIALLSRAPYQRHSATASRGPLEVAESRRLFDGLAMPIFFWRPIRHVTSHDYVLVPVTSCRNPYFSTILPTRLDSTLLLLYSTLQYSTRLSTQVYCNVPYCAPRDAYPLYQGGSRGT